MEFSKVYIKNNTLHVNYRVRNHHIDSYGHVNNASYLLYLEDARSDFFEYLGYGLGKLKDMNIYVFITEIKIKYLKPAYLDDIITVTGNFTNIGRVRATWIQKIFKDSILLAEAYVTGAFLNGEGKIIKIPDFIKEKMVKFSLKNHQ